MREPARALAAALLCAAASASVAATATVKVSITVQPYAEVRLDQEALNAVIPQGRTTWSVSVGGTVLCNAPVMLSAAIAPPDDAPGGWVWTASTRVTEIYTPGTHDFTSEGNELLTITVENISTDYGGGAYLIGARGGHVFNHLAIVGQTLPHGSTPETPPPGNVVVTATLH